MIKERDIYNPPPAPVALEPPPAEPWRWTRGDVAVLVVFSAAILVATVQAWTIQPTLAVMTLVGGALVILESWFTALGFLQRHPLERLRGRWSIYLAALVPWMISLGLATAIMLAVFLLSDWTG